jgi:hypothetical protein
VTCHLFSTLQLDDSGPEGPLDSSPAPLASSEVTLSDSSARLIPHTLPTLDLQGLLCSADSPHPTHFWPWTADFHAKNTKIWSRKNVEVSCFSGEGLKRVEKCPKGWGFAGKLGTISAAEQATLLAGQWRCGSRLIRVLYSADAITTKSLAWYFTCPSRWLLNSWTGVHVEDSETG